MAVFERDGVRIDYEVIGDGPPVLLIAPGGLRSRRQAWSTAPWNPMTALPPDFRVIAMDQRNAGGSYAPITRRDGWASYTADQLALLQHLEIERCTVVGMCIGGPYIIRLLNAAPERFDAAVLLQPIGLEGNRKAFEDLFDGWAEEIRDEHPEADQGVWAAFKQAMFGGDFMFGASRDDVAACSIPMLVMMGSDLYHPSSVSREVAALAPNAGLIEAWKAPQHLNQTDQTIRSFLAEHAGA